MGTRHLSLTLIEELLIHETLYGLGCKTCCNPNWWDGTIGGNVDTVSFINYFANLVSILDVVVENRLTAPINTSVWLRKCTLNHTHGRRVNVGLQVIGRVPNQSLVLIQRWVITWLGNRFHHF